ncbi:multiple epidermal growth factor-like domains protein 10 isoform X1 [Mizuhopecten yessoensis]|uniref:multiple epidermal growth factor-like domains protein 10 isoform X1 n=1 Tax=Mizuhopecten yessoensis TaxID=6573 RepID=UPI000B45BC26|nr:multiple epidermal growth factor-like domains protein 10 isoform X1 [Mizuhopecten yessoensis]
MSTTNLVINRYVCLILFLIFNTTRSEANVALVKPAEQSSKHGHVEWVASKAVDGCTQTTIASNCCTHTQNNGPKQSWWRVNMGDLMTINSITIYYRDKFQKRFAGYQLYLSNTTESPTQGVLCFEDKSATEAQVQLLVTHQCPYVARYVTVYNYRNNPKRYSWYDDYAVIELCEVQVFGCQVGQYGNGDCNSQCSGNCYGGNCNSTTGSCFYCFPGKYGDYCNNDCSTKCTDITCEKDTGYCSGCNAGFRGNKCDQSCPANCEDQLCIQNSGDCTGECAADRQDRQFRKCCILSACDPGFYGSSCNQKCSGNCKDKTCVQGSGLCKDCEDGFFGPECNPCSTGCVNPTCNKSFGNCSRCNAGFHGNNCDQSCPANCEDQLCIQNSGDCTGCDPGYHGSDCYQTCSANCANQTCDQNTGQCTECKPGLFGPDCTQTCPVGCQNKCDRNTGECNACEVGKYGLKCDRICLSQCHNGKCKQIDGHCEECIQGFHGDDCSKTCQDNCKNKTCLQENGHCSGCKDGYFTDHCDRSCPSSCMTDVCDMITGLCMAPAQPTQPGSFNISAAGIGIGSGVVILALVVLVIILVRRLSSNKTDNRNSTHMTDLSQSVRREELQKNTDGTYDEIGSHTMKQPTETNRTDANYEQLNPRDREPTHIYNTA